jgi:hypothetical protein
MKQKTLKNGMLKLALFFPLVATGIIANAQTQTIFQETFENAVFSAPSGGYQTCNGATYQAANSWGSPAVANPITTPMTAYGCGATALYAASGNGWYYCNIYTNLIFNVTGTYSGASIPNATYSGNVSFKYSSAVKNAVGNQVGIDFYIVVKDLNGNTLAQSQNISSEPCNTAWNSAGLNYTSTNSQIKVYIYSVGLEVNGNEIRLDDIKVTMTQAAPPATTVSGNIYRDPTGALVSGTGTNAGGVYASLVNSAGAVVATVPVAANGSYTFPNVAPGTYSVALTTSSSGSSNPSLPAGWVITGEGYQVWDPVKDGKINNITVGSTPVTAVNFLVDQLPTAGTTNPTMTDPGGTGTLNITSSITGTDPDGTIAQVHFTTFPTNVTSITIGGINYVPANWPAAGVTVPYGTTVLIDPAGTGNPVVPYKVFDNAGKESTNTGSATINLATPGATPDLTPSVDIDGLSFPVASVPRDFVVNVFEINGAVASTPLITVRIAKLSAFTITFPTASGSSDVYGGIANENSNWNFTENASFIIATAKPGVTIPANGSAILGFSIARKPGVTNGTTQNLTTTIVGLSGGETNTTNNKTLTSFTASAN